MFIIAGREVIHLSLGNDGFYRDQHGTIFALRDDSDTVDLVDRCGVGVFSLPGNHPLNDACRSHDYMYSSPAYQAFHSRAEADAELGRLVGLIELGSYRPWAPIFEFFSRLFGGKLWENKKTR